MTDIVFPPPDVARSPHPHMRRARAEYPVAQVPGRNEFLVTRRDDVRDVLTRPEVFSSTVAERRPDGTIIAATLDFARSDIPRPIQQSDPPKHTVKRRLAFEAFKPARLVGYKPMIARIIDELIDDFTADGEVEFVSRFATPLPARVIHNILGIPESDAHLAAVWGAFEGQATRYHTPERQATMAESIPDMGGYVAGALTDRHENPRDDVLSDLIAAHVREHGEFILPELVGDASNLFLGGIITTSHMLGWTMWMLLDNAGEIQRATADETEMVRAIEESLRLEPPVPWTSRLTPTDTEVAGVAIPSRRDRRLPSRLGQPRRGALPRRRRVPSGPSRAQGPPVVRLAHPLLHRGAAREARGTRGTAAAVRALARSAAGRAQRLRAGRQHGLP